MRRTTDSESDFSAAKISRATLQNWTRLKPDLSRKLDRGANKSRSKKRIRPGEYISCADTWAFAEQVNRIRKEEKLSLAETMYSAALKRLTVEGIAEKENVRRTLEPYRFPCHKKIHDLDLPSGEWDLLGALYQSLLTEGEKNTQGSYYTPPRLISAMLQNRNRENGSFLDPCCGSGAFLLSMVPRSPEQLWGCDRDPVAVMIAKINLLCRYPESDFIPRIFCCDYLSEPAEGEVFREHFDCIATNPPWGAELSGTRGNFPDSFSRFFVRAFSQLKEGGKICFLFPESVLNVGSHRKFREKLLTETRLNSIRCFEENFSGVMTKFVSVEAEKKAPTGSFFFRKGKTAIVKHVPEILQDKDRKITFISRDDQELLQTVEKTKVYDLSASTFALGIVTGNNRETVHPYPGPGMEPVYTGKEIDRYVLKQAVKYLRYDREQFQQTAPDCVYRAPEKLVYRFISPFPVFAYDASGSLCLNSANILIPSVPGYSIRTVLAFLNSDLIRFWYSRSCNGIKVLKSSLLRIPFPAISPEMNRKIESLVTRILQGDQQQETVLQALVFRCYGLTEKQIAYIRERKDFGFSTRKDLKKTRIRLVYLHIFSERSLQDDFTP